MIIDRDKKRVARECRSYGVCGRMANCHHREQVRRNWS
nr:MAG TPA: hypothetical protein [Bacteriophage sp.]